MYSILICLHFTLCTPCLHLRARYVLFASFELASALPAYRS